MELQVIYMLVYKPIYIPKEVGNENQFVIFFRQRFSIYKSICLAIWDKVWGYGSMDDWMAPSSFYISQL